MSYGWGWKPYVSVAQRRAEAKRYATKLAKKGRQVLPVEIAGRKIAATLHSDHLEFPSLEGSGCFLPAIGNLPCH